ncbi:uncharacterized protein LOC143866893 [Tasmannia lanceolata]|uniref:uncharacterized protein LOC143866893 n=1 Tax=Tasmannia lanceolata TaxID=3420 RepID=UPI004064075B
MVLALFSDEKGSFLEVGSAVVGQNKQGKVIEPCDIVQSASGRENSKLPLGKDLSPEAWPSIWPLGDLNTVKPNVNGPWRSLFEQKKEKEPSKLHFDDSVMEEGARGFIYFSSLAMMIVRQFLNQDHSYAGRPLILIKWRPGIPLEKLNLTSVPIWIRFPRLPLEFWSAKGISKIASFIGNPLYMDSRTTEASRLYFARLCVEVEVGGEYPETIPIHTPFGVHVQSVEYDWKPTACKNCHNFSHTSEACPKNIHQPALKTKQEWRPIKSAPELKCPQVSSTESGSEKISGIIAEMVTDSETQNKKDGDLIILPPMNDPTQKFKLQNSFAILEEEEEEGVMHEDGSDDVPEGFKVNILEDSYQYIHGEVQFLQTNIKFLLTAVYAANAGGERRNLWTQLIRMASAISMPWIVAGDFNCYLADLRAFGHTLSWNNNSGIGDLKFWMLDRALGNDEWFASFPNSSAEYKNPGLSDHSPIVIRLQPSASSGGKPFRFFNMWLRDTSIFELVERAWAKEIRGNPMFKLCKKLQEVAANPANAALKQEEISTKIEFTATAKMEESMLHQKSRVSWLNLGDSNNSFFYSAMNMRRNQNSIQGITRSDGQITTDSKEIEETLISYFKDILPTQLGRTEETTYIVPDPVTTLNNELICDLLLAFTEEEICITIDAMDDNKAPGPDGFNGAFFKSFWYLIGKETVAAIQYFFVTDNLLPTLNTSFISLIPKCNNASTPDQYRPISLCNHVYKVITKLMANRMREVMHRIINPSQSAFIKGRLIQENVLLTHDICHKFHRKSNVKSMCVKIDLKKAYDNVCHRSLVQFLRKLRFPDIWCKWILQCISTPSFSILINGSPRGFFRSSNGLRQGDPISPLLFCVVMEMLSCILYRPQMEGRISSPFARGNYCINHLFFADDVMLFADANLSNAAGLTQCLLEFKVCSGLEASLNKSEIFFSGIPPQQRVQISSVMSFCEGVLPVRYLGLPLVTTRLTKGDCQPLISRIRNKIALWSNKNLSRAGRLELIKTVLSLPDLLVYNL